MKPNRTLLAAPTNLIIARNEKRYSYSRPLSHHTINRKIQEKNQFNSNIHAKPNKLIEQPNRDKEDNSYEMMSLVDHISTTN